MSTLVLTGCDEFSILYLAQILYPDHADGREFQIGETNVRLIVEYESMIGLRADRIILFDEGQFRDIEGWKDQLYARLAPGGRLFVIEHKPHG